jgi:uncharacterized membrane protein
METLFAKLFGDFNFLKRLIYYLIYVSGGTLVIDEKEILDFNYIVRTEEVDGKLVVEVDKYEQE